MNTKTLDQLLLEYDQLGLHIKQLCAMMEVYAKAPNKGPVTSVGIDISRALHDCEQETYACELRLKQLHQEIQQRRKEQLL